MRSQTTWRSLSLKLAACVVALGVTNSIVHWTSPYFQREDRYHELVRNISSRPEATTVFAGDSHVAALHNEQLGDTAYNIASGGDSLRECYAKLSYLLEQPGNRITTVIVSADFHMFGSGRDNSANRSFADYYFLSTGDASGLRSGIVSTVMDQVSLFNDDFVKYLRESISRYRRGHQPEADGLGTPWYKLPQSERDRIATETGRGDHFGVSAESEGMKWFARIVALAKERRLRLVAIRLPAHPLYFAPLSADSTLAVDSRIAELGVQEVHDFRFIFDDPAYFEDPDHLSEKGMLAFLPLLEQRTGVKVLGASGASERLSLIAPVQDSR